MARTHTHMHTATHMHAFPVRNVVASCVVDEARTQTPPARPEGHYYAYTGLCARVYVRVRGEGEVCKYETAEIV